VRIVVADDLPASALDLLRAEGWTIDAQSGRTPDQLKIDLSDADALVVRSATKVTPDIIAAAPKLRAIARAGTGVDNVHVETASARGIVVMNAPGANSISVAELAMAQLLSLARKLPAADASMKQGLWDKKSFVGEEVRGKVLGLAGLGRIGQEVARRAQAFEMTVIAHDPFIAAQAAADLGIELVSMDDLCARADYLSLHMPSTPQTKRTFNADRLAKCKKGLRLINTARGDLIDESALVAAIESGQIGGAAIDVYDSEPTKDHSLQKLAHRSLHARRPGAGGRRDGIGVARLPQDRRHSQRGEFSRRRCRRVPASAAVHDRGRTTRGAGRPDGRSAD
jgi:D-3-phosphoglycerate dehydrogenase / 2-oxoglutarate reductase